MTRITRLTLRRPRVTVAAWFGLLGILGLFAIGVEGRLTEADYNLPGTDAARELKIKNAGFGTSDIFTVLLVGPRAQLDRQGPTLARALRQRWPAMSPWDVAPGASRLRPGPDRAVVVANVSHASRASAEKQVAPMENLLRRTVRAPVQWHMTAAPVIARAIKRDSLAAARTATLIATPILLLILLLVFRSVVAAAIPAVLGFATVVSGTGVVSLLAPSLNLTSFATSLVSIMGLALGVDYTLLIVSRFREELAGRGDRPDVTAAAAAAALTAGRTVLFAGVALTICMLVALVLCVGNLSTSAIYGVLIAVILSMGMGTLVVPALLSLIGTRVNKWRIGPIRVRSAALAGVARQATRRPILAVTSLLALLLAATIPATALNTAPASVRLLPPHDRAREDHEAIQRALGPGYESPFEIVFAARKGVITDPGRLAALARFQDRIARDHDVALAVGPGTIATATRPLLDAPRQVATLRRGADRAVVGVKQLRAGLSTAASSAGSLQSGAELAASGAARLEGGAGQASGGAQQVSAGVQTVVSGAQRLRAGLDQAHAGLLRLRTGSRSARSGAGALKDGLAKARRAVVGQAAPGAHQLATGLSDGVGQLGRLRAPAQVAQDQVQRAWDALNAMNVGRTDQRYSDALDAVGKVYGAVRGRDPRNGSSVSPGYDGLDAALAAGQSQLAGARDGSAQLAAGLDQLGTSMRRLDAGAGRLEAGIARLERGYATVERGIGELASSTGQSQGSVRQLAAGASTLASRLGQLHDGALQLTHVSDLASGAGELQQGLATGLARTKPLQTGLAGASALAARFSGGAGGAQGASILRSGHMTLAAIDSAPLPSRSPAGILVNLNRGGQVARMLVIPKDLADKKPVARLRDQLVRDVRPLARQIGADAAVGGTAGQYVDYARVGRYRLPLLVLSLSLVSLVLLVFMLRALVLPIVAVLLNLLTVGATVGLLTVLFGGSSPPLGGPGFIDLLSLNGIFAILFSLAVDYEVFLLVRIREGWLHSRDTDAAILYGVDRTAAVVTGAAFIMTAVFGTFAFSELTTIRQLGVGLVISVLIDALLLRLVLLPAAMRLLGPLNWWLPRWLDRLMPQRPETERTASRLPISVGAFEPARGVTGDA
ncbi:MAG: MMPL family transporter [Gaiellaceae bacterium]